MMITNLKNLGFSEKEIKVYLAILEQGPAPVRKIAASTEINRGTTYDILKSLIRMGLVSYYHQDKHKYFVAEDPEKLKDLVAERQKKLSLIEKEFDQMIPELKSIYDKAGEKPVVKFYEGGSGIKTILQDCLKVMAESRDKEYYVYSAADIRKHLYQEFPNFAAERIKKRIKVKVIALGSGGQLYGLDQRKWLRASGNHPTYIIIYHRRVALLSIDKNNIPLGVLIEDDNIYQTQKLIFQYLWEHLP